jgi:thiamine pyrophosphate-dependent acetolactate synthase large subunit-like protein
VSDVAVRRPQVADAVGAALARAGVDTVFGVLGSGNLVATNALVAGGARFHAARHEGGAVCMADGWARVTGRVGVCSVHQGPGLTNTMTGLAEAVKASTPLLVLAADTPAAALTSNFRIDQHGLVGAVGAAAERVHSPASAAADALRALRRAELERRPVVLMLPIDLQTQAQALAPGDGDPPAPVPLPAAPAPSRAAVAAAADLLQAAGRPVFIAGRGAVRSPGAATAIEALAARCGALLATSAMANGLFATSPWGLGISGGFASPVAAELIAQADLVVSFGATLNHWTTRHGRLIDAAARVVQVDLDAAAIGANQAADLGLVGDACAAAEALTAELAARDHGAEGLRTHEVRDRIACGSWRDQPNEDAAADGFVDPRALSVALDDLLPDDRAVVVDSGHFTGWPAMYLRVGSPDAWVFANGFQAVGLGLGNAIGAAVARPDRITVAALGDGGLFLALQELDTAVRLRARLLVLVYDDAAYGAEVHHFAPMGHDVSLVRFPDADLAAAARAAGAQGITVRSVADLAPVAGWVRDGDGPLLVDAKVDPAICAGWLQDAFRAG